MKIKAIDALDICNIIGEGVVVGGEEELPKSSYLIQMIKNVFLPKIVCIKK